MNYMKNMLRIKALLVMLALLSGALLNAQGLYNNGTKLIVQSGCNLILHGSTMNFVNQTNGTSGTVELAGHIYIQGSWYNNSSAILDMSPYNGTVYFNGTDTQLITHSSLDKYSKFYGLVLGTGAIVKVPAAKAVTVTNTFTTTGAKFLLKSDSAHGTASLIDNNGGAGTTLTVERWIRGGLGYHFLSSPVNDSPTDSIWNNNGNYWFYTYNEQVRTDSNRDKGWVQAFPGQTMVTAKGYSSVFKRSTTRSFKNEIVSGNPSVTITLTNITGSILTDDPNGWNLLGNPWPSAISIPAFITDNTAGPNPSITGTVYFWDDVNGTIYRNNDYASRNGSGGIAARGNPGNSPNAFIPVGQGFFVQKYATASSTPAYPSLNNTISSTVVFNRSQRDHEFAPQFYIPDPIVIQRIWLDISGEKDSIFNEILVACLNGATDGYDNAYDGLKLKGNPDIALFSILNGKDYAIQGLPALNGERKQVQLGMDIAIPGKYTFKPTFENFDDANNIYLEDKVEKRMINLRTNPDYQFQINQKGTYNNRFILWFNPDLTNMPEDAPPAAFNAYSSGSHLVINMDVNNKFTAMVTLYDMTGKQLYNQKINPAANEQLDLGIFAKGCYIVRITGSEVNYSQKVIIQ